MNADLELTLSPGEERISLVRRFVEQYYEKVLDDEDAVARIAMAAHELLENAAKYSTNGVARMRIEVAPNGTGDRVRLVLRNHGDPDAVAQVRSAFDEMRTFDDPFVWYQTLMRRTAKRRAGSGLGLARIAAEGEMKLDLELAGDEICICAETIVARRNAVARSR
jgi:anti-sigma regulatory factor (Ser/Thr protein kinase)